MDDEEEGPAESDPEPSSTDGRVGVGRGDRPESATCVGTLEVDEVVVGLVVPATTGGGEVGVVFFLVDIGVRSRQRAGH